MDHSLISQQVRDNLLYLSGDKRLTHAETEIPYAPAEIMEEERFAGEGGGLLNDYSWAASTHTDDYGTFPVSGDLVVADGGTYQIEKVGKVSETGEVVLYFTNPDA